MVRVLKPAGTLVIANCNSFVTSVPTGWIEDRDGRRIHYPIDRYLEEAVHWVAWSGIRTENWHRPLSAYLTALLGNGLQLRFFDEPAPIGGDEMRRRYNERVAWFLIMEWQKP